MTWEQTRDRLERLCSLPAQDVPCQDDIRAALERVEALRAAIRGALGTRPHNDFSPECEYERILRAALGENRERLGADDEIL